MIIDQGGHRKLIRIYVLCIPKTVLTVDLFFCYLKNVVGKMSMH